MDVNKLKDELKQLYYEDFQVLDVVQTDSDCIEVFYKIPYSNKKRVCQIETDLSMADMIDEVANSMFFACDELIEDIDNKREQLNYITDKKIRNMPDFTRYVRKIDEDQ